MQTFCPYSDFVRIGNCLDLRRLNNQINEGTIILKSNLGLYRSGGWKNHPAAKMWKNYPEALAQYIMDMAKAWNTRTNKQEGWTLRVDEFVFAVRGLSSSVIIPDWLGSRDVINSHRSNLLRKDFKYYSQFNWKVPNNLPYFWPDNSKISFTEHAKCAGGE